MSQPIAVITGCSSGIGRALAKRYQKAGYSVWACARKSHDVAALNAEGFVGVELDVNNAEHIAALANALQAQSAPVNVLINNAGYGAMGPLLDEGASGMQKQFATNVFSLVALTQALFPRLRASKGLVINIGSISSVFVTPFAGAYCASKAAVHAMSDALRMELAPFDIRVMEVQPGAIASSFGNNAAQSAEEVINPNSPWWPLRTAIMARANASQQNPTSAEKFADTLFTAAHRPKPPRMIRIGNGSTALPLMAKLLPQGLFEKKMRQRFGLNNPL